MIETLKGYKTYFIAAAVGAVTVFYYLGYMDGDTYSAVLGFLGAGGLATLRAGIKNG